MGAIHLFSFSFCVIIQFFSYQAEVQNTYLTEEGRTKDGSSGIWHSYFYNTGAGNREGLHFSKIQYEDLNVPLAKGVKKWAVLQNHKKTSLVGLSNESLILINYNSQNDLTTSKILLPGKPSDITLFQNWNATSQQTEGYAIVAVSNNIDSWLNWYRINENRMVYLWNWPVHRNISYLEVIRLNEELKLLMITHGVSDIKNPSADVYSFSMDETFDLWFFNRILLDEIPSSAVVCNKEDQVFFSVSLPKTGIVHVFQYSSSSGEKYFKSHQRIEIRNVTSLISFRISFKWYLGIASSSSAIYSFKGDVLVPVVQELGYINYWLSIPVKTYRQDVIILAKKEENIEVISGIENGEFELLGNLSNLICREGGSCLKNMNEIFLKGSSSFYKKSHHVIFPSNFDHLSLLTFSVKLQPLVDVVTMEVNEVLDEKKNLESMFKSLQLEMEKLINESHSILNSNTSIELTSKWIIKNLTAVEIDLPNLENVNIANLEIGQNKNWTKKDLFINIDKIKSEIASLKDEIKKMKPKIKFNGTESEEQKGLPEFIKGGIIADGVVYVDELEVDEINGVDIEKFLAETYRLDRPQKIKGIKTISDLEVDDVYFSELSGIPAENILYADDVWEGNNVINGDLLFENDLYVTENVTLLPEGLVNNLKLKDDVPTMSKKFNGTFKFEDVEILEESNIKKINNLTFILPIHNSPYDVHMMDNVFQARIEQIDVENDLNVNFINGENFTALMEQIMMKTEGAEKNSSINLKGVLSASDLEIEYLNGIKFPEGFILASSNDPVIIDGEKNFLRTLTVDNVDIESGNFQIRSMDDNERANVHVYENLEIVGILTVDMINDKPWDYYEDIVEIGAEKPVLTGTKNFTKSLKVDSIKINGKINNRRIDDILTNNTDQIFNASQVFETVVFQNLTLNGTYDGVCVKCLNETINVLSLKDSYSSDLIFKNSTCEFDELNILESLNENITVENSSLVLNGDVRLQYVRTRMFNHNGSLNTFGKLNDINVTEFHNNRLSLTKRQNINHDIYHPNITIRRNLSVFLVNGKDVGPAFEEDKHQKEDIVQMIIDGKVRLKTVTVKGNITTKDNVNNVNLTEFSKNAINIKKEDSVPGEIIFEDKIEFKELEIGGRIDGIDLKKLKRDVVRSGSPIFSRGAKNFTNGIRISKSLRIRTLNGHLMGDVATFEGDNLINSTWVINGNVTIRGNLTLHGSLNDVQIQDLQRKFSTEYNSFIIPGDVVFKGKDHTVRKLLVNGEINNVDFDEFMSELVWKDRDVNISGSITFLNEIRFDGNLTVEKAINQIDFTKLSKDVVLKNQPAKIEGSILLKSAKIKNLIVKNDFNSTLIHGRNTDDWLEECIPLDKNIFVSEFKFFENIKANGDISADYINDHSPENMITLKGDQYISEPVIFSRINSTEDIQVDGTVNGRNLKDERENTVMMHGDQTIYGEINFMNGIIVDGDVSIPSASNINLENLTTLHTDQVITTEIEFQGPVLVDGDVEDLKIINGIDLHEWNENSVFLNREQTINGTWTILGDVTMLKNVEGDALLNSMSIPLMAKQVEKKKFLESQIENELDIEYETQCQRLQNLSFQLTHQPYLFKQFDLIQVLDPRKPFEKSFSFSLHLSLSYGKKAKFDPVIESIITFEVANNNYLIMTFVDECYGELHRWDEISSKYVYLDSINLGPVQKWKVMNHNATTYLITTSSGTGVLCEDYLKPGNVWSFDEEGRYGHVFTSEAFTDIILSKNFSDKFYTLAQNGSIFEWTLQGRSPPKYKFLIDVGKGDFRFLDFDITGGLAVARTGEIKKIDESLTEVLNVNRIPGLDDGEIASLSVNGKIFTAVARRHQVIIYDDILLGSVVTVIHSRNPTSLNWINFGPEKEIFLIFQSRNRVFEVYQYKGAAGFKRKMSRAIPSQRIQSVILPDEIGSESHQYVIIIGRKKMFLLKAQMYGHLHNEDDINC